MKSTIVTALVAATVAVAPLAHAAEGNGNPFPFNVGPIGAVQFVDGVAVAVPERPTASFAAGTETPAQPSAKVAEMPAARGASFGSVLTR